MELRVVYPTIVQQEIKTNKEQVAKETGSRHPRGRFLPEAKTRGKTIYNLVVFKLEKELKKPTKAVLVEK